MIIKIDFSTLKDPQEKRVKMEVLDSRAQTDKMVRMEHPVNQGRLELPAPLEVLDPPGQVNEKQTDKLKIPINLILIIFLFKNWIAGVPGAPGAPGAPGGSG